MPRLPLRNAQSALEFKCYLSDLTMSVGGGGGWSISFKNCYLAADIKLGMWAANCPSKLEKFLGKSVLSLMGCLRRY